MTKDFFLTGVSSGIGRHLAKRLVGEGARVLGIARTRQSLEELQRELGRERFLFVDYDVSRLDADITPVSSLIEKEQFSPTAVILNAAVSIPDIDPDYNFKIFKKVMDTNLYGAVRWIELFLPQFQKKRNGHFIGISSIAAYHASPRKAAYTASKAALSQAFDSFRLRYLKEGIQFTTIHFGPVNTPMWDRKEFPGLLPVEAAVDCIVRAIREKKPNYDSPRLMGVFARSLSLVPRGFEAWLTERVERCLNKDSEEEKGGKSYGNPAHR